VEYGYDLALHHGLEIDQKVAATDQVEARERRIAKHVLRRKHHELAQAPLHPIDAIEPIEEAGEPLRRDGPKAAAG
jgi:hypothetical protein